MKSRFKVSRVSQFDGDKKDRVLLTPWFPDFDGEDENPVDDLIFEIKVDATPMDFEVQSVTEDRVLNDSGLEISVNDARQSGLVVGAVVDIEITEVAAHTHRSEDDAA